MNKRIVLVVLLIPCFVAPLSAGIIFGRKAKPNPKERVPELIAIVKTDGDENKRAHAAEELRQYDPSAFPEIVPVLIDVLMNDKKPSVRAEAAQSLGKLRPVSQSAGLALEQAVAKDTSMTVRLQARSALLGYRWAGYRSIKKEEPILPTAKEPPLAEAAEKPRTKLIIRRTSQPRIVAPIEAPPKENTPPVITTIPGARPLPQGPVDPARKKESGVSAKKSPKVEGPDLE